MRLSATISKVPKFLYNNGYSFLPLPYQLSSSLLYIVNSLISLPFCLVSHKWTRHPNHVEDSRESYADNLLSPLCAWNMISHFYTYILWIFNLLIQGDPSALFSDLLWLISWIDIMWLHFSHQYAKRLNTMIDYAYVRNLIQACNYYFWIKLTMVWMNSPTFYETLFSKLFFVYSTELQRRNTGYAFWRPCTIFTIMNQLCLFHASPTLFISLTVW